MFKIANGLTLPEDAVTQTFAILARRGAGKTYTASVLAEEMLGAGYPIVWLDPLGVAWGLREKYSVAILGGERGDIPLQATGGRVVADFIVSERVPTILDVSLFGENEMRRFVADFADQFYRKNREAIHWFVDEADEFAPEGGKRGATSVCLGAMQNIVRRGRARGIGVTLITQRSAVLSKSVLTQTECLIAMQTTHPKDLKVIEEWISYHGLDKQQQSELIRTIPKFKPKSGQAWVYSPGWLDVLKQVRIRKRRSFDSSATPEPGEKRSEPKSLKQVDMASLSDAMAATIEEAKASDPKELKKRIRELEKQLKGQPSAQVDQSAIDQAVARAVTERDKHWKSELAKFEKTHKTLTGRMAKINQLSHLNGEATVNVAVPPAPTAAAPLRSTPVRPLKTGGVAQRIIDSIASLESVGIDRPSRSHIAFFSGYKNVRSKGFANAVSQLSTNGKIFYPDKGTISLTPEGRVEATPQQSIATTDELHERLASLLKPAEWRLLSTVIDRGRMERSALAEANGYTNVRSKGFANLLSRLSSLGLVVYPNSGEVEASELVCID